ncbi:MAG: HAMP domain-containing histidine kinase, partial [Bacteroidales bacterium]|nr:HAMP domain-containing histidine kinase [Bacteroidales bacterium]
MHEEAKNIKGIALVCDPQGYVESVWRDDLGLEDNHPVGKLFVNLIDSGTRKKALNFIHDIRTHKVAFDYELNLPIQGEVKTLSFLGILLDEKLLVLSALNKQEAMEFTNYRQQINNEQANSIRELIKNQYQDDAQPGRRSEEEGYFDEITRLNNEMANLQRLLSKKNTELEQVNQLKNRFMGIAAHDLRNPLNIILSYADFLQEEAADKLDEEQNEFLNNIVTSSNYMLKLIENLLDYSKIESGDMKLEKEEFDIVQLARHTVELNRQIASRKQIEIHLRSEFDKKI